jgi:hypothetical protein
MPCLHSIHICVITEHHAVQLLTHRMACWQVHTLCAPTHHTPHLLTHTTPPPPCRAYWLGLKVSTRPDFVWNDPAAPFLLEQAAYRHWAQDGAGAASEPDNGQAPPEDCGVARAAQAYGGAWGWADVNCSLSFISVCKVSGGCGACGCGACGCGACRCGACGYQKHGQYFAASRGAVCQH